MRYYLFTSKSKVSEILSYPAIVMRRDSWDDFGYKTTLELTYYPSEDEIGRLLGYVKILNKSDSLGYTQFESSEFDNLGQNYCSLGQSADYYINIKKFGLACILEDIRDCAISDIIRNEFKSLQGFHVSLLRSSRAEKLLYEAKVIFSSQVNVSIESGGDFSFDYEIKLPNSREVTNIEFNFSKQDVLPYRINVIVGKNACGKSQILSSLALKISGMMLNNQGEVSRENINLVFGGVHVISYSPFDVFKDISELNGGMVSKNNINSGILPYNFYGIRKLVSVDGKQEVLLKSHMEIKKELIKSYNQILKRNRRDFFMEMLEICLGESVVLDNQKNILNKYDNFSSGQKILFKMIADFLSSVDKEDLVLIDEPETYLHPQGISNFYHCLNKMLFFTKAYCIIATHSPMLIQETPSKYITILSKVGSNIKAKKPKSETLGQGLNSIVNEVFKVDFDDLSFFDTLQEFYEKGISIKDLEEILGNHLDFSAKSYYMSLSGKKNEK